MKHFPYLKKAGPVQLLLVNKKPFTRVNLKDVSDIKRITMAYFQAISKCVSEVFRPLDDLFE